MDAMDPGPGLETRVEGLGRHFSQSFFFFRGENTGVRIGSERAGPCRSSERPDHQSYHHPSP